MLAESKRWTSKLKEEAGRKVRKEKRAQRDRVCWCQVRGLFASVLNHRKIGNPSVKQQCTYKMIDDLLPLQFDPDHYYSA